MLLSNTAVACRNRIRQALKASELIAKNKFHVEGVMLVHLCMLIRASYQLVVYSCIFRRTGA